MNDVEVRCSEPSEPGTIARVNCRDRYERQSASKQQIISCGDDGIWSPLPEVSFGRCLHLIEANFGHSANLFDDQNSAFVAVHISYTDTKFGSQRSNIGSDAGKFRGGGPSQKSLWGVPKKIDYIILKCKHIHVLHLIQSWHFFKTIVNWNIERVFEFCCYMSLT